MYQQLMVLLLDLAPYQETTMESFTSNFAFLHKHELHLMRVGMLAEKYCLDDPNTSLIKSRQFIEYIARQLASRLAIDDTEMTLAELLRELRDDLPRQTRDLFRRVRLAGNDAAHNVTKDLQKEQREALSSLKLIRQLGLWYYRSYIDNRYKGAGPFIPPQAPQDINDTNEELAEELAQLQETLVAYQAGHQQEVQQLEHAMQQLEQELQAKREDMHFWETMALEAEKGQANLHANLAEQRRLFATYSSEQRNQAMEQAEQAAQAISIDEAETRRIIDQELCAVGWEADTLTLRYSKGTRPEVGRNLAIAEYPLKSRQSADYVLFIGEMPVGIIEAKRGEHHVPAALEQAKRYSRSFPPLETMPPGSPWQSQTYQDDTAAISTETTRGYALPFLYASNGRPHLPNASILSGTYFIDIRRPSNLSRSLHGWHSPETLQQWLTHDSLASDQKLAQTPYDGYDLKLRPYQQEAIEAVERTIANGQRHILLAMATGTGKTRTAIALIYRLLKAQRFHHILFVADRNMLVSQAIDSFKTTRFENMQTFADTFGIVHKSETQPNAPTAVHVATVQSLVHELSNEDTAPPIDRYDCIIIDECHRGYTLDREMSEQEQQYRSFEHYLSKYRRAVEYFDAVRIGLTATPALHTTQIFGEPVYQYSYRRAVLDGVLVDHDPPIGINTKLAIEGMHWNKGEKITMINVRNGVRSINELEDELSIDIDKFNSLAITEAFNDVICQQLAKELDPHAPEKTLIFCVNDAHADMVVQKLKYAMQAEYGDAIHDDTIVKITGKADKPDVLLNHYKNEVKPKIAVTVDLLTTGIDVPKIGNLVFLRRVRSRILYEQMLGRATRRADDIGKERFRIFDAVRLYEALEEVSEMRPVVTSVTTTYTQLIAEILHAPAEELQEEVRESLVAKLQRKRSHLQDPDDNLAKDIKTLTELDGNALIETVATLPLTELHSWLESHPMLGDILDAKQIRPQQRILSEHEDTLQSITYGYGKDGKGQRPEDYLESFKEFLHQHREQLPALTTVLTRPSTLRRKDLKSLRLELNKRNYSEGYLDAAYQDTTDLMEGASIIGYIRNAMLDEPLQPFAERVNRAYRHLLKSQDWNAGQKRWLSRFAEQLKTNYVLDQESLDAPNSVTKRQGGGFARIDEDYFHGELEQVLVQFHEALWQ